MIAGTFKSCKVFEIALQFSECGKLCCFCRIVLGKKSEMGVWKKSERNSRVL